MGYGDDVYRENCMCIWCAQQFGNICFRKQSPNDVFRCIYADYRWLSLSKISGGSSSQLDEELTSLKKEVAGRNRRVWRSAESQEGEIRQRRWSVGAFFFPKEEHL